MKYLKMAIIILTLSLCMGTYTYKSDKEIPLTQTQLENLFPDSNFRKAVSDHFKGEEITIKKLESLKGEFYASGENINSIDGISYLKNIDTFIFWNNNIKDLPKEIIKLDKIENIDIRNNYLTDEDVINKLKGRGVNVNCDLNFIYDLDNQYNLKCKNNTLKINKGESISIKDIVYKEINNYEKEFEIIPQISNDVVFNTLISNDDTIEVRKGSIIGKSKGKCHINININSSTYNSSSIDLDVYVD